MVADSGKKDAAPAAAKEADSKPPTTLEALQSIANLLEKSVKLKDTRLMMGRLLRQTASVRKNLTSADLSSFVKQYLPSASPARSFLLEALDKVGDGMGCGRSRCTCTHI